MACCGPSLSGSDAVLSAVPPDDTLHNALDLAELDLDGLKGRVGGLKPDVVVLLVERLERGLAIGQEGDDAIAVACDLCPLDEYKVTVEDALVLHRVTLHAQGEGRFPLGAAPPQDVADIDLVLIGDFLDRVPRGDLAHEREAQRARLVGDRDSLSDRQRASLVRLPNKGPLLDEGFDVLEDG